MTSQVVINDIEPRTQAVAIADQTVFNTNWTADATTDVDVYSRGAGEDADDQTQLVDPQNYSVEFIGTFETVRVTFAVGRSAGDIITIVRNTPANRLNLYTNTNFTPSMLNQDVGILTLVDQQNMMYDMDFCPHYNLSCSYTDPNDIPIDTILPILDANEFWVKNTTNTKIVKATLDNGGLPVSGPFVTYAPDAALVNAFDLGTLTNGLLGITVSGGIATPFSTLTPLVTSIQFSPSTSGIIGTLTNDSASAGIVGEFISSVVPFASSTMINNGVPANVTSISLTAGDWDVYGNIFFDPSIGASTLYSWISLTSATQPDQSLLSGYVNAIAGGTAVVAPYFRASLSATTTVYLTGYAGFASGTVTQCGAIYARRVR